MLGKLIIGTGCRVSKAKNGSLHLFRSCSNGIEDHGWGFGERGLCFESVTKVRYLCSGLGSLILPTLKERMVYASNLHSLH